MDPSYSESDTHDFAKSCVSFSEIGMSIHKQAVSEGCIADRISKNVYETQRTDDPYTTGRASAAQQAYSLCTTDLPSAAQQAHSPYKTKLLVLPGQTCRHKNNQQHQQCDVTGCNMSCGFSLSS